MNRISALTLSASAAASTYVRLLNQSPQPPHVESPAIPAQSFTIEPPDPLPLPQPELDAIAQYAATQQAYGWKVFLNGSGLPKESE